MRCPVSEPKVTTEAVAAEFAGWEIAAWPGELHAVGAYWQSADGRHRRFIVARTPGELLAALRAADPAVQ
jgi:hypothetical protein